MVNAAALRQPTPVGNYRTGALYTLLPLTEFAVPDDSYVSRIATICNEPPIYDLLFAERCAKMPYAASDAERFLHWARRGWAEQTHFVYLLLNDDGVPAGAIDIKSSASDAAEIGYWLSNADSGVMTNAVEAHCSLATNAGFRSLYALVRVVNQRSASVLVRARFAPMQRFEKNGIPYERWERSLA